MQARGVRDTSITVLAVLAALIGLGSFLFHTFADRWSELADVGPIWGFVAFYIFTAVRLLAGVKPGRLLAIFLGVAAVVVIVTLAIGEGGSDAAPDPLNGSGQYAPALVALLVFAALVWRRSHPQRIWVLGAAAAFGASLVFRTFDMQVCAAMPLGSHFMWHVLNGVMVALLLQFLIRARAAQIAAR